MRATRISLLLALLAGVLVIPAATQAAATPKVVFTRVWYDSPGLDYRTNTRLNREYVIIQNAGKTPVDLTDWVLHDRSGHKYEFGAITLRAGGKLRVNTGAGTDAGTTLYWGYKWYVWNNDRDKAFLRDASGHLVASCAWSVIPGRGKPYTNCAAKPKPKPTTDPLGSANNPYPNVHPGAFCSPEGAYGTTNKGTLMRCTKKPGESQPRWRAA